MHFFPRSLFYHSTDPFWNSSAEYVATIVAAISVVFAVVVLVAVAPLSLLMLPTLFVMWGVEWINDRKV